MKLDSTITISIILAICALFAPSITAIINNRHQYKIRKLELRHNFITNKLLLDFSERFSNHTISNRDEYITELNKIADSFNSELSSLSCE